MTKHVDPITFEIVRHRLYRVVEEAVITLKHVSGSAITNEGHDLMVSLYTADGGLLLGGVGFLHHLSCASQACKAIIERFKGRVNEEDMYLLNDPYTAALHTSDVYIISPIHFGGELVAWSASFVHVSDIGAMNPGGFCPDARDIYSEGFSSPGLRLIERGQVCEDIFDTLLNMVRVPELVTLDIRSMIACNNVARQRMRALYDKYGLDVVAEVSRALIDQSERLLRARLRELPDGRWTARQYMDVAGRPLEIRLAMTKRDDTLAFDFSGTDKQIDRGINCTRWGAWGGLLAPLYPLLCHDFTWNEGVLKPISMIAPEGTIVNAQRPTPVSIATVGAIQAVNNASLTCISKMLAASPKYAGEATAVWMGSHLCIHLFARNQRGQNVIGSTTETFSGAGGARWSSDGIDLGGEIPNPISRMANIETNEMLYPIRYLFRRRMRDSGGAGEFRGGTGGEYAMVPHDAPDGEVGFVVSGKGVDFPMSHGLAGGYPGIPGRYIVCRGARPQGTNNETPLALSQIGGNHEHVSFGVYRVKNEDVFYVRWNGGGGMRDPLSRDVQAVARDVEEGVVTPVAAHELFGVVLSPSGDVDNALTETRRRDMRKARIDTKVTVEIPTDGMHSRVCKCKSNGSEYGLRTIGIYERLMSTVGPAYSTGPRTTLSEMICTECGALVDTQVTMQGAGLLLDGH
jgi:N-methylhydantoinase B